MNNKFNKTSLPIEFSPQETAGLLANIRVIGDVIVNLVLPGYHHCVDCWHKE